MFVLRKMPMMLWNILVTFSTLFLSSLIYLRLKTLVVGGWASIWFCDVLSWRVSMARKCILEILIVHRAILSKLVQAILEIFHFIMLP